MEATNREQGTGAYRLASRPKGFSLVFCLASVALTLSRVLSYSMDSNLSAVSSDLDRASHINEQIRIPPDGRPSWSAEKAPSRPKVGL